MAAADLAVTGAFLAREAAGLLLRKRGKGGTAFWLAVYSALFLAGALPLVLFFRVYSLLPIGIAALLLFGVHSWCLVRGRLDRSQWGEILGVGALTLTAPAAVAVTSGRLTTVAWLLWAACLLYYSSSIFSVKMVLSAARAKRDWSESKRREIGRDCLGYHLLLTAAVGIAAFRLGGREGILADRGVPASACTRLPGACGALARPAATEGGRGAGDAAGRVVYRMPSRGLARTAMSTTVSSGQVAGESAEWHTGSGLAE